jgi:hypothetical protein
MQKRSEENDLPAPAFDSCPIYTFEEVAVQPPSSKKAKKEPVKYRFWKTARK